MFFFSFRLFNFIFFFFSFFFSGMMLLLAVFTFRSWLFVVVCCFVV